MEETFLHLLFYICLLAFAVVFIYYAYFLLPLIVKLKPCKAREEEALSVIVCARNEEDMLVRNIPEILKQDYSNFQLVLVDDCSLDGTWEVMKAFEYQDKRVKLVRVNENDRFYTSKKFALTLGIKAASNDLLVLTDADCRPNTKQWLKELNACFGEGKDVVLGYGDYEPNPGVLNALIRFDTALIACQYASFAKRGLVYMGVGRNLAYRKSLFMDAKGFSKHQHIDSGDDDLFVGHVATRRNTSINMTASAKTWSQAKSSFIEWQRQKGRHLTTYKHYAFKHRLALGIVNAAQALSISLAFFLLFTPYIWVALSLLMIKSLSLSCLLIPVRKEHKLPYFILIPLLWELMLYAAYPLFFISSKIYKKGTWKI